MIGAIVVRIAELGATETGYEEVAAVLHAWAEILDNAGDKEARLAIDREILLAREANAPGAG